MISKRIIDIYHTTVHWGNGVLGDTRNWEKTNRMTYAQYECCSMNKQTDKQDINQAIDEGDAFEDIRIRP
jgi:hypothetical protein